MTKTIDTLVEDIQEVLKNGVDMDSWRDELMGNELDRLFDSFGNAMSALVRSRLVRNKEETRDLLRMSSIGQPCSRKLYYSVNNSEEKEELTASMRMKFLFGDILEEVLLLLAELSGHEVSGRQDEAEIVGVKGHQDAVIDGTLIDVKSASTYSFKKFEEHGLSDNDPFGYITQIQSYLYSGIRDGRLRDTERCGFLVVDKTLGNICLDIHPRKDFPYDKMYEYKKDLVSKEEPPARGFSPVPEGKSGNYKLPMNCSYCDFKKVCHPDLRTFIYSNGPVYLTKVAKTPNVPEVL